MRIGEIAIVGPHAAEQTQFINAISKSVKKINEQLVYGEIEINNQLVVHLYGIAVQTAEEVLAWDLLTPKLLGFVAMFKWGEPDSFRRLQAIVDKLIEKYDPFIIVAAHSTTPPPKLPASLQKGVPVDKKGTFIFCDVNDEQSVRAVLLALVDKILNQVG